MNAYSFYALCSLVEQGIKGRFVLNRESLLNTQAISFSSSFVGGIGLRSNENTTEFGFQEGEWSYFSCIDCFSYDPHLGLFLFHKDSFLLEGGYIKSSFFIPKNLLSKDFVLSSTRRYYSFGFSNSKIIGKNSLSPVFSCAPSVFLLRKLYGEGAFKPTLFIDQIKP